MTIGYMDGKKSTQTEDLQQWVWKQFHFQLDIGGAAEAIPVVETKIRRVKERMRAVYNTLPYKIDLLMMTWLTRYAALRLNREISSNSKDGLTARERLYGRRNDKNWVRHGYGDYVQVHDKYTNNKMKERTQGALSLCPTGNMAGTWYYLVLRSWKVVRRNGATMIPSPARLLIILILKQTVRSGQ